MVGTIDGYGRRDSVDGRDHRSIRSEHRRQYPGPIPSMVPTIDEYGREGFDRYPGPIPSMVPTIHGYGRRDSIDTPDQFDRWSRPSIESLRPYSSIPGPHPGMSTV